MTTKLNKSTSLTTAPLNIFADQPAAIQIGPHVSKFTLGVIEEDESDFPRPVVTIAMPTVSLMRWVADLNEIFSDAEFKKDNAASLASDIRKYFSTAAPTNGLQIQQTNKRITKSK